MPEEPVDIELEGSVIEAEGPPPELTAELGLVEREGAGGSCGLRSAGPLLAEVRRAPHLTREEEHRLAVLYREHEDREAGARLILASLRVVVIIAMEYRRTGMPILDLIQEGNLGLLSPSRSSTPTGGIRLNTYASWWIRAYVLPLHPGQLAARPDRHDAGPAKALLQSPEGAEAARVPGVRSGAEASRRAAGRPRKDVIEMDARLGAWEVPIDQPVGRTATRAWETSFPRRGTGG